jgi:PAS domain-containing protein
MIVAMGDLTPIKRAGPANENGDDLDTALRSWRPARRPRAKPSSERPLAEQPSAPRSARPQAGLSEIATLDADGRIVGVNEAWKRAAGQTGAGQDGDVGAFYVDAAARFLPDLERSALEQGIKRLLSGAVDDVRLACAGQTASGPGWRLLQIAPLPGEAGRFLAIHADQTELATTREALKATSEQLVGAKDDERRRIAMELHDSTCQHLVASDGCGAPCLEPARPSSTRSPSPWTRRSRRSGFFPIS